VYDMPFIGPWEIALILAIVLLLFGPKKLPELAKSMGDAIRQYKTSMDGGGGLIPGSSTPGAPKTAYPAIEPPVQPISPQAKSAEVLLETAKNLGIKTEGKTMDQISEEITEKASQKQSSVEKSETEKVSKPETKEEKK
jgi:sec-independent protein translocase protein TatA